MTLIGPQVGGFYTPDAAFDPASLFGGSDDGWYWFPSLETTFTDAARTTATTVGNAIGGVTDSSGSANHGSQSTDSKRMILRQAANGNYYYESDTSDDALDADMILSNKRMTVAMAFKPLARNFMLLMDDGSSNPFIGIGQSGSTSTEIARGVNPLHSTYFDNVLFTGTTRGDQYTEAQASTCMIVDFTMNGTSWTGPAIGKYNNGNFYTPGDTFATLAIDRELTSTERTNLNNYFMALVP